MRRMFSLCCHYTNPQYTRVQESNLRLRLMLAITLSRSVRNTVQSIETQCRPFFRPKEAAPGPFRTQ